MTAMELSEHKTLLGLWARGKLNRNGILRCMVLSRKAERDATEAFVAKFSDRTRKP